MAEETEDSAKVPVNPEVNNEPVNEAPAKKQLLISFRCSQDEYDYYHGVLGKLRETEPEKNFRGMFSDMRQVLNHHGYYVLTEEKPQ